MTPAAVKTKRYVACPACGALEFLVEHLFENCAQHSKRSDRVRWYCDECGAAVSLEIDAETGTVMGGADADVPPKRKTAVLLALDPQPKPVFFVVEGVKLHGHEIGSDEQHGNSQYFYEEHSCPSNSARATRVVIANGDTDPHGIFRYVKTLPLPDGDTDAIAALFADETGVET